MAVTWKDLGNIYNAVGSGQSAGDIISGIAQANLNAAANQNVYVPTQNPNVVPAIGATQSRAAADPANVAISQKTKWIVGGLLLVGLYFAVRKGR